METMFHAILEATFVSKCVLVLLLCMSVGSWAFMYGKFKMFKVVINSHKTTGQDIVHANTLDDFLTIVAKSNDTVAKGIITMGVYEFNRLCRTNDATKLLNSNVRRSLRYGITEELSKLASSLSLLATTSNTAPFIGLFGTVWGIMYSFTSIATMKSVSLATVAPGIAEALIATAVGLFVAIPATAGFNIFKSKIAEIEGECVKFAGLFLNRLEQEVSAYPKGIPLENYIPQRKSPAQKSQKVIQTQS